MDKARIGILSVLSGIFLIAIGLVIKANDLGDAAYTTTVTYTVPTGGTLTITNGLLNASSTEWITAIEVCHEDELTNNVFTVTRTRDTGFDFDMWTSDPHTNDSVAIEFVAKRGIKSGDVIDFVNSVTGGETKVYVTKQTQ